MSPPPGTVHARAPEAGDESPAGMAAHAARRPFLERYRLLFNRRGYDWWSVVFGYPLARLLLAALEPAPWLSPTALTLLGFGCKLSAAVLLLLPGGPVVVAVALLLNVAQVLDSMDGTLARARGQSSRAGALLDKTLDGVGFAAVALAFGHRAAAVTGASWPASLGGVGAAGFVAICYVHWVARAASGAAAAVDAAGLAGGGPALSWREIAREWARAWKRIVHLGEADQYLWMSLLALLGCWRAAVCLIAAANTAGAAYLIVHHWRRLRRTERAVLTDE
jgi:phosphatidylglycerophosphate synthase